MNDYNCVNVPINSDTNYFWEGCKKLQLNFQRCSSCKLVRWPPSYLCPSCHSTKYDLFTSSGRGKIYSFVVYHKCYHSLFAEKIPYISAVIELEENIRFLSRLITQDIHNVECGMNVELVWDINAGEYPIPLFKTLESNKKGEGI